METRSQKLFLIDHDESQITGPKLPSNGQVLRVLFYNMRKGNLLLRPSANLVIIEVEVFWEKARIRTNKLPHSIEKLESLYKEWKNLQKNCKRRTYLREKRERNFLDMLDDLLDIAHADALEMIKIEEDKLFLISQRKKERPGSMIGGRKLFKRERKQAIRNEQEESRRTRYQIEATEGTDFLILLHFYNLTYFIYIIQDF